MLLEVFNEQPRRGIFGNIPNWKCSIGFTVFMGIELHFVKHMGERGVNWVSFKQTVSSNNININFSDIRSLENTRHCMILQENFEKVEMTISDYLI